RCYRLTRQLPVKLYILLLLMEGRTFVKEHTRPIIVATWVGIIVNTLLAIVKAIGGFLSGSRALIADALHSTTDIIGSVVILFVVVIPDKQPDEENLHGYGRAENIASIIVALLRIVVGI